MNPEEHGSSQAIFKYDAAMKVVRTLRDDGYQAVFAGGCVRDLLLRRRPQDYDIATDAKPEDVKALFERTIPIGEEFGVMKVVLGGVEVEVATFRSDLSYSDGRRPSGVKFGKSYEDAQRRDFTVNGMFFDPVAGGVIDHVGGRRDLAARRIRAIGDPEKRFGEDYLRTLRAVRFAAGLGFEIERETFEAIQAGAGRIEAISGERIRAELETMLVDPNRRRALEILDASGLLAVILPEVAAARGVRQGRELHPEGDVWEHTLLSMGHLEDPSFELAMGVLLHDIGKPPSAAAEVRPFLNHERIGERMTRGIAARLKLSKRETEVIAFLVRYHMILKDVTHMRKSTLKRIIGHELFGELAELHRIDALASNGDLSNYEFAMRKAGELSEEEVKPDPLVNGRDLAEVGIEPGPRMGGIIEKLYTAQLDEEITTRQEALEMAKRLWQEEPKE